MKESTCERSHLPVQHVTWHSQKRAIQKFEESLKYTVITFISDVGGILGIFLGFSFWSIHATAIIPLLKKIFKPSSSEVQPWTGTYISLDNCDKTSKITLKLVPLNFALWKYQFNSQSLFQMLKLQNSRKGKISTVVTKLTVQRIPIPMLDQQ